MDPELQALEAELASLDAQLAATQTVAPQASGIDPATANLAAATTLGGGALNIGDLLTFGLMSKGIAAGSAVATDIKNMLTGQEAQNTYADELAKIQMMKDISSKAVESAGLGELNTALEFMAPTPSGKAKTFFSIMPAVKEAGLGLASYFGSEAAQAYAPESEYAGLVGALAAPAGVKAASATTKGAARAISPSLQVLLGNEDALRAAAQKEVIQSLSPGAVEKLATMQQMPALLEGTGGAPLTLAEALQEPSIAKYQLGIGRTAGGGDALATAQQLRQTEIAAGMERLGTVPEVGQLSTALQEAAAESIKSKDEQAAAILEKLGISPELRAQTTTERGASLLAGLSEQKKEAKPLVDKAYKALPKKREVDAAYALTQAERDFRSFDSLEVDTLSSTGKKVINNVTDLLNTRDGRITIGKLQALRSTAGAAIKEASGKNPREVALMRTLREDLDLIGVEQILTKKADAPKTAIEKLKEATALRREFGEKFEQGATGQLLKIRRLEPVVKASQAINLALRTPENVTEIISKFGKNSDSAVVLRAELLSRLEKHSKPTKYIDDNKELFKRAFEDDFAQVSNYANKKTSSAALEEFADITDAAIPRRVYANEQAAEAFAKQFADTPILDYARGKFLKEQLLRGNALANLGQNRSIASKLFGDSFPSVEAIIKDSEILKSPGVLEKLAVGNNSITAVAQTALGAIRSGRVAINMLRTGKLTGPAVGAVTGVLGGGPTGAVAGTLLGTSAAVWAERVANARELQLDKFAAELLANPKLIKLAAAPPTASNIDKLLQLGERMGYISARAVRGEMASPDVTTEAQSSDPELAALEAELASLEGMMKEAPQKQETVKVGKQNISIPTGEEYAPPSLVKAVIQVESVGNPNAVSPKGATGLMQLMPGTAKDLGVADRFDPKQNVEGGSRYLQQMISKYGETDIALAAYNWGPLNIDKAISKLKAEGKRVTWANIKEIVKVPEETRLYVNKVLNKVTEA
jgi:soluble lytic murein transglycosylase-like protein